MAVSTRQRLLQPARQPGFQQGSQSGFVDISARAEPERGRGMAERSGRQAAQMRTAQDDYIRSVAGAGASPTDEIAKAKALLDAGTIDQTEFEALKAKAMR